MGLACRGRSQAFTPVGVSEMREIHAERRSALQPGRDDPGNVRGTGSDGIEALMLSGYALRPRRCDLMLDFAAFSPARLRRSMATRPRVLRQ